MPRSQVSIFARRCPFAGLLEAEGPELVWVFIQSPIPHHRLLRDADCVAGWDVCAVGELEVFQDLSLCGDYGIGQSTHSNGDTVISSYVSLGDQVETPRRASSPVMACS